MDKLYYIENEGCDDTTHGLARISDEDFPKFKAIIENLNKNSNCGCMPTISVYELGEDNIKEVTYDPEKSWCDEGYVDRDYLLHMDGKTYTIVKTECSVWSTIMKLNKVI